MAKKKIKKSVNEGCIYIQVTFNNSLITITDMQGNVLSWSSSGSLGFKGNKKSTPFATQLATETAIKKVMEFGLKNVHISVKGPGIGRDSAIRSVVNSGLTIKSIKDITPIPHNGCRPPKVRRG